MKIACDICEKIEDSDFIKDWLTVSTKFAKFCLCEDCEKKFWALFDEKKDN